MLSRNASPSDALASGMLNNLRRINLGANTKIPTDADWLCHRFQQDTRLHGIKVISDQANTMKLTITKNGTSFVKDAGMVAGATALTDESITPVPFLDANTDGYVDFSAGDLLVVTISATANINGKVTLDLDLVQG